MDYNYEEYLASLVNEVKKEKKIKYENNLSVKEDMKVSFVEKEESKKTFTSKETFHENDKKSKEIILENKYSSKGIFSTGESKEAISKNFIPIETVIVEEYRDTMLFNTNSIDSYAIQKSDSNLTYNFNNLEKEDEVTTTINSYEVGFINRKPTLGINHEIDYIDVKLDKSLSSGNFIQEKPTLGINHEIDYIDVKLDKSLSSGNFVLGRNDFITGDINNGFISSKSGTTVINAGGAVSQSLENAYGKYSNLQSDINKSSSVAGTVSTVAKELEFQFSSITDKGIESWLSDKIGKITNYPSWSYRVGFDNVSNLFNGFVKLGGELSQEQIDPASLINTAVSAIDIRNIISMGNPFTSKERYNKGRHDLLIDEKNTAGVFDNKITSKGYVLTSGLKKNKSFTLNPLFSKLEEGVDGKYKDTIISPKSIKDFNIKERFIANKDMVDSNNDTIPDVNAKTIITNLNSNDKKTDVLFDDRTSSKGFYLDSGLNENGIFLSNPLFSKLEEGVDERYKNTIISSKPTKDFEVLDKFIYTKDDTEMVDSNNDTTPDVYDKTILDKLKERDYSKDFVLNRDLKDDYFDKARKEIQEEESSFFKSKDESEKIKENNESINIENSDFIKEKIVFKPNKFNTNSISERLSDGFIDLLRTTEGFKSTGYIYINPVYADAIMKNSKAIRIPIQTNLKMSGDSLRAEYNKIDFLNRIGSIAQYTRTDSRTVEIETTYFVETNEERGFYSMNNLQSIEFLYKSLLIPQKISENRNNRIYNYMTRPPVINIVMGADTNSGIFIDDNNNMLNGKATFGNKDVINNMFTSVMYNNNVGEVYYRSFVATDLTIEKESDTSRFYLGENGSPLDYAGFTVRLSLLEIDPNYLGVNPTFDDYALFGVRGVV